MKKTDKKLKTDGTKKTASKQKYLQKNSIKKNEFSENKVVFSQDQYSDEELENPEIDLKKIKKWETNFTSHNHKLVLTTLKKVQQALQILIRSVQSDEKNPKETKKRKWKDVQNETMTFSPKVFNGIIKLCLQKVPVALYDTFEMNLSSYTFTPKKHRKWPKLSSCVKNFIKDVMILLRTMSEPSCVSMILKKGILPLLPFYCEFPKLCWSLTRQLGVLWCTGEERVRVMALIALFRILKSYNETMKDRTLKFLYISYVKNCRFTSPTSWPVIDFMRSSLVELYCVDEAIAYRHGFVYIRQLVMHLRNATTIQDKKKTQLVHSWQFMHCLHLWAELIGKTHPSDILTPLLYPIVQTCNGVLSLSNSAAYVPTVFAIVSILIDLIKSTGTHIPVLPYLSEVLLNSKAKTRAKVTSLKPLEWECILKVSTKEIAKSSFTDGVVDKIYELSIEYLNTVCSSITFPELSFLHAKKLRKFLKISKTPHHNKKIKQLLDKIVDNSKFISDRRKDVAFTITDKEAIKNWQIECEQNSPPLRQFYQTFKVNQISIREKGEESSAADLSIKNVRARSDHLRDSSDDEDTNEMAVNVEDKTEKDETEVTENVKDLEDDLNESDGDILMHENYQDEVKEMELSDFDDSDQHLENSVNDSDNSEDFDSSENEE